MLNLTDTLVIFKAATLTLLKSSQTFVSSSTTPLLPSSQPRPGHPDDPPAADCSQSPDPLLLPGAEGEVWVLELSTEFRESFHNIRRIIGGAYISTFALKIL